MQNPHPGFFTTNHIDTPTLPYFANSPPPYDPDTITRYDTVSPESDNAINKNDKVYIVTLSYQNIEWVHSALLGEVQSKTGIQLNKQNKAELALILNQTYQQYYLNSYYLGETVMEIVKKLNTLAVNRSIGIIVRNIKETVWYKKYENADYNPVPDMKWPELPSVKGTNVLERKFE